MNYRYDIQELRGISFLLVFVYHLNSNIIPGGFIGVDIFFVISGYIITASLSSNISSNNRLFLFYCRRIKRLFPASFTCLIFFFYYHPSVVKYSNEETQFFFDILSGLLCFSNIRFNIVTNSYFQFEKKSIILNYWSLSLEEQFYLIYPFCYYYIFKKTILLIIVLIYSFFKCVINTYKDNSCAYYFLSNRAWELLIGCLNNFNNYISFKYSELIVCNIILLSYMIGLLKKIKFPGFISLFPTSLAFIIVNQNNSGMYNSKLLSTIGNISYVLYLFHYPIIQINNSYFMILSKLFFISVSVHKYIEMPLRNCKKLTQISAICLILLMLFLFKITNAIKYNKLKEEKINIYYSDYCKYKYKYSLYKKQLGAKTILLLGDSHLGHYLSVIETVLIKYDIDNVLYLSVWIINIEKNYISLSHFFNSMKKLLLCIVSLYVDYSFFYSNKYKFEYSFKYLIKEILFISNGIIILQDNPHRFRTNDTKCRMYLLPAINDKRITYVDIFNEYCKGIKNCLENIYSTKIFSDMHHLNKNFVCKSRLIYQQINSAINRYIKRAKNKTIKYYEMKICFKNNYNLKFLNDYNITTIVSAKYNIFGLAAMPIFK